LNLLFCVHIKYTPCIAFVNTERHKAQGAGEAYLNEELRIKNAECFYFNTSFIGEKDKKRVTN